MSKIVIAIDGPAGAGKSTVAKALAKELGLQYLDTGAMYRALALAASRAGLSENDGDKAAEIAKTLHIHFAEGAPPHVILNDEDVTTAIRTPEIGELASALSTHSGVRRELVKRQQAMVAEGGYTLEGRDVTTVVAPNADVKVYLTASLEERAKRRHVEMSEKGMETPEYDDLRRQMQTRDHRDITRDDSPLTVAEGATIIESGGLSIDEVVAKILELCEQGK
ncbi:MAG: cytidylate kinase [Armatimonadetes bacterium 55-13]|nr:MAG: cytidylate kinase [Armatimonadetes bacterium 55-13]